jgi:hypothetical protein
MEDRQRPPGVVGRCWLRLLDGDRQWGSVDIRPDRFGVIQYRLVVYPPGISEPERRRVRVWRGWPMWGALLWIVSEIVLTNVLDPWTTLAISTAAYLGTGVVTFVAAGDARARVRTMGAMVMAGYCDPLSRATCRKLQELAATLSEADEHRSHELISAAEHELVWWRVYDQMEPGRNAAHRANW